MYPILLSIGPFHVYSFSIFLLLAWGAWSFLFWRSMRDEGVLEEQVFDLMFYGTLAAFIGARGAYVATHWTVFTESFLKIGALWVAPGLSLYGGLLAGIGVMVINGKRGKVRIGQIVDSFTLALPFALIIGKWGSLADGAEVGIRSAWAYGVIYPGHEGLRHPVQLYEILVLLGIAVAFFFIKRRVVKERWAYGMIGVLFFVIYGTTSFVLEFVKDGSVYWQVLRANQWVLLALTCESLGALYVRSDGKRATRKFLATLITAVRVRWDEIYAKFSKPRSV